MFGKSISYAEAEQFLNRIPDQFIFHCNDGTKLGSLQDLHDALVIMRQDTFYHHITPERNDFSTWVHDVIGDKELAKQLRSIREQQAMTRVLEDKIIKLKKVIDKEHQRSMQTTGSQPVTVQPSQDRLSEILDKERQILEKEREISLREQRIEEIEGKIEQHLSQKPVRFFSKEFIQGLIIGILLCVIAGMLYIKFWFGG